MKNQLKEKDIEKHLREKVKAAGGKAYKFISPGNSGVPDRIVLLPPGVVIFVELKAPGKTSTTLQKKQQEFFKGVGCMALVIDSKQGVDELIETYERAMLSEIHTARISKILH